jgi:thiol-disulfide isomerase/thioredoxin
MSPKKDLQPGRWRGVIEMQQRELPFTFDVQKAGEQFTVTINNADEKLTLDEVTVENDSVRMVLHIFDAELRAQISGDQLTGTFVKNYAPNASLPFRATFQQDYRFAPAGTEAATDFSGTYQLMFSYDTVSYPAVGIFTQTGNQVTGTFLTPTGDYRYLEGNVVGDQLQLSAFDGNHAFIFEARLQGDTLAGDFFSGGSGHEQFKGVKNSQAALPDAEKLTYLKPGFDQITFRFPALDGSIISPQDDRFKGKVLILQIFGSWCPNCMDETRFLADWYRKNRARGVEVLGLAYERKDDFAYASERVKKMKEKLGADYEFVIAGTNDKKKAAETLPMLNHVLAFPTTIFIGRDGKVKHIHTGFSGPGTGIYYEQFVQRFNELVAEALQEGV